jgi:hypothetical protein
MGPTTDALHQRWRRRRRPQSDAAPKKPEMAGFLGVQQIEGGSSILQVPTKQREEKEEAKL